MNKRRNIGDTNENEEMDFETAEHGYTFAEALKILSGNPDIGTMRNVFNFACKEILTSYYCELFDEVIRKDLVGVFVQALASQDLDVQKTATFLLENILCEAKHHVEAIENSGGIEALIKAAFNNDHEVAQKCLFGISYFVSNCAAFRDRALKYGMVELMKHYVYPKEDGMEILYIETLVYLLAELSSHVKHQISIDQIAEFLPIIKILLQFRDDTIWSDLCGAISYLTNGKYAEKHVHYAVLDMVIKADILPRVFESFNDMDPELYELAVNICCNFTSGSFEHVQYIFGLNIVNFENLFLYESPKIVKAEISMLSNILSGSHSQIQAVIDETLVPKILQHLRNNVFEVQVEAISALSNLCEFGTLEQLSYLTSIDIFSSIAQLTDINNSYFLIKTVSIINRVFYATAAQHPELLEKCKNDFWRAGGIDRVEELQNHENFAISQISAEILDTYFADEND
uniref:Uncharacterized protein n=1 Tax=Panagrolaimus sp. ES5 TaxID=591445 RepID=A0AC34FNW9_9BILA